MPTIRIDMEVLEGLQGLAKPFVDTPNSVIRKLLVERGVIEETPESDQREVSVNSNLQNKKKKGEPMASYSHTRLCFKARYIEPLNDDDVFEIESENHGRFRMTKKDFYRVFSNVVKTKSYREEGIYHYPVLPEKALQFKVGK